MQKKRAFRAKLACVARLAVFGLLSLLFAVLTVLELIPNPESGVEIKETVRISSASLSPFDAAEKEYTCLLTGVFSNDTDADIRVDSLRVIVGDGKSEKALELSGFTIPKRASHEISHSFEDVVGYDRVSSVSVTVGGEEDELLNRVGDQTAVSAVLLFYLIGVVASVLALVDSCKRCVYLRQELRARSQNL